MEEVIREKLMALAVEVGPRAEVNFGFGVRSGSQGRNLFVSIYPHADVLDRHKENIFAHAPTLDKAIELAREENAKRQLERKKKLQREMALKIIELTHQHGSCTDAALRGSGFAQEDIDALGENAVALAGDMSALRPFEIVRTVEKRNEPYEGVISA